MDQHLSTQEHINNLRAFQNYERRLRDAYKRATTPQPQDPQPRGRNRGRVRG